MTRKVPLYWLVLSADDLALFEDRARVDAWEGGFADLIRLIRHTWETAPPAGAGTRRVVPVWDYQTYRRLKDYGNNYGDGTWQTIIKRWADQLPDGEADPQRSLFA